MLILVAALRREAAMVKRRMRIQRVSRGPTWRTALGTLGNRQTLLVQTGMGRSRSEAAIRSILSAYDADALISFGFAGALTEELKPGDLVLASEVYAIRAYDEDEAHAEAIPVDLSLLTQAEEILKRAGIACTRGGFVTELVPVTAPEEKRTLHQRYDAVAVDMESAWMAQISAQESAPFLALRAISDTMDEEILPFDQFMTSEGGWKKRRAVTFFLRHPSRVSVLLRLAAHTRWARRSLSEALWRLGDGLSFGEE
jgi:adenosylhomocysteine nucleosidase